MHVTGILVNAQQAHMRFESLWREAKPWLMAGHQLVFTIKTKTRSLEQNARLWVLLDALSRQIIWHGQKLTAEEWKDACTAALKRHRVIPGIDGGFVVLGQRTSTMTVAEMVELHDFVEAFGAQQGVDFTGCNSSLANGDRPS
jgi:hypothetical protein